MFTLRIYFSLSKCVVVEPHVLMLRFLLRMRIYTNFNFVCCFVLVCMGIGKDSMGLGYVRLGWCDGFLDCYVLLG
jgi:hypothetical protein